MFVYQNWLASYPAVLGPSRPGYEAKNWLHPQKYLLFVPLKVASREHAGYFKMNICGRRVTSAYATSEVWGQVAMGPTPLPSLGRLCVCFPLRFTNVSVLPQPYKRVSLSMKWSWEPL